MREPKYQAWLIGKQVMVDVMEMNLQEKYILYYDLSDCNMDEAFERLSNEKPNAECVFEHCELREYTGLKDKDGREIYEGDILKYDYDETYNNTPSVVYWDSKNGKWAKRNNDKYSSGASLANMLHCAEVIGNIYENLGLVTATYED